jgi:hypothetical protein
MIRDNYIYSTNMITSLKAEDHSVFYFYFDIRDQSKAKVTYKGLLSSLMLDIGLQLNHAELKDLHERYSSGRSQMPAAAMQKAIFTLLEKASVPAYIFIDAMDECQVEDHHRVVGFIQGLLKLGLKIHISITCRYAASSIGIEPDIKGLFEIMLAESVVATDIQKHIQKALNEYRPSFIGIKDEVEEALIIGAHGQ